MTPLLCAVNVVENTSIWCLVNFFRKFKGTRLWLKKINIATQTNVNVLRYKINGKLTSGSCQGQIRNYKIKLEYLVIQK